MWMQILTLCLAGAAAVLSAFSLLGRVRDPAREHDVDALSQQLDAQAHRLRAELSQNVAQSVQSAARLQADAQRETAQMLAGAQRNLQSAVSEQLGLVERRLKDSTDSSEQKLEAIRQTMEQRVSALQADNARRLDEMRATVDEKLQKTLDETLARSFARVSEQLESVYKGLGEMQTLAAGVGDLKKVLSNVKTRGILGEVQLGAILEQLLSPGQYGENVATVPGSAERVEYAVRLPGEGDAPVWLPIDAKFPTDAYAALLEARESADAAATEAAGRALEQRVRGFARDIHQKYIAVPHTTEFGVMFLPVEGLYAEVVQRGMVERLQNEWKVMVAGPTTMAALLNSLQMGFRTLAIQKRSGEVWQVLGGVKAEFETFGRALEAAQSRIEQAGTELEKLVGVRTRQMQRRLASITQTPQPDALADSVPEAAAPDAGAHEQAALRTAPAAFAPQDGAPPTPSSLP